MAISKSGGGWLSTQQETWPGALVAQRRLGGRYLGPEQTLYYRVLGCIKLKSHSVNGGWFVFLD